MWEAGTTTGGTVRLPAWRAQVVVAAVALVLGYLIGTRFPHTDVQTAYCDTTEDRIRCYPEGYSVPVVMDRYVPWRRGVTWYGGFPECLAGSNEKTGPVELGLVDGGDDGAHWEQVVWVACP